MSDDKRSARGRARESNRGVLGTNWEDALRAGQEAEGGAGTVEDELAIVHLLRHAAGPEVIEDSTLDRLWGELEPEVAPTPWWRKPFVIWGGSAVAATAAAVVLVIVWPAPAPVDDPQAEGGGPIAASGQAAALQKQFELLAPAAREEITKEVESGRSSMRSQLIAMATSEGKTAGGAP